MSIAKRVAEALVKSQDPEAAFLPACVAVDATAAREHPDKRVGDRYRTFVRDNLGLIGAVGLRGIVAQQISLTSLHPELKPDEDGNVSIEDVLYTVIRCGLLHEATIAEHVTFSPGMMLGYDGGKYDLAPTLPMGLIAAVIASPANADERIGSPHWIAIGRQRFDVDSLWGKRRELLQLLYRGQL